jgi:hypothetical protein
MRVLSLKTAIAGLLFGQPRMIDVTIKKRGNKMTIALMNRGAWIGLALAMTVSTAVFADDMASFATGGYARGLRSEKLLAKMDTDGDHMMSKAEWLDFQEKIFTMLDKKKTPRLSSTSRAVPSPRLPPAVMPAACAAKR